ncbi:hypothetical protein Maynard_184 [Salmonella phage Maynard]|uniref:Uncharacterized protein n=39 Tax=Kuttervirus TaxID=2169536 RepID=A0A1W5PUN9_9CAUD|nr:hypothetical protein CBA120_gp020 [Escherichia phage Cba120]YP_007007996.1 hypothetical protein F416_gp016 [Salmonella phage Sh19]YP_008771011.1 hypothetical protein Maynard_184 [Salmonella phage Maynard]YP_008771804.1 hypothetical protein Marshall_186 [Salmonella phage Marshall]YP_009030394.1 hypothetical protein FF15_gp072 [Salmonella phage vB-SalM-SJ3]YP_009220983.1 hypothetical protein SP38_239 [Salmonella phage 38]YP_009283837.1 hypothetical protein BI169_gp148 [Salmonella phage GG32]
MKREITEEMLAKAVLHPKVRFAFIPTRLHDGNWVWLEHYVRAPIGLYAQLRYGGEVELKQYRVGGGLGGLDDGEYFPHRNFAMNDNSYFKVEYATACGTYPLKLLLEKAGETDV